MKKRKNKKLKVVRIIVFMFILVLLALSPYFLQKTITIKHIECKSQYGECPKEIQSKVVESQLNSLFEVKRNIKSILKASYLVSDFSMQYRLPDRVQINIVLTKPYFSLQLVGGDTFARVGSNGRVLAIGQSSNLPTAIGSTNNYVAGAQLEDNDLFALRLVQGVFSMYQARVGVIQGESLIVELPGGVRVIFPLKGDRDILLGSLRLIYSRNQDINEIDLRFGNPILR